MAKNIGTLGKYDQRRLWKWICIVNPFNLFFQNSQKSNLPLDNTILNGGKYHYEIMFFSNTCWTQLLASIEILMSKISLKYILIHIHNFEPSRVIMNIKLSSHGFLLHRNINRRDCTLFISCSFTCFFGPAVQSLKVLPVQACLGSVCKSIRLLNPWPTFSYAMKQNTLGFGSEPKGT